MRTGGPVVGTTTLAEIAALLAFAVTALAAEVDGGGAGGADEGSAGGADRGGIPWGLCCVSLGASGSPLGVACGGEPSGSVCSTSRDARPPSGDWATG